MFGPNYEAQGDTARTGLVILLSVALTQALLSVTEAVQIGFQEQYVFNLWTTVGNATSLVALLFVAVLAPSVIGMIVAVNVPPIFARVINSARLVFRRPFLVARFDRFAWPEARFLLGNGLAFSLAASLGNFLNHQYILILVGRTSTTAETSSFAIVMNVFMLAFGFLAMIGIPLWPAIADSLSRGERGWARAAYRKALTVGLLYAAAFAIGLTLLGDKILPLWFGRTVNASSLLLVLTGIYFIVDVWEYIHFTVLIGLKRIWLPSLVYFGRSLIAIYLAPLLLTRFGSSGAMVALILSVLLSTGPVFWLLVRRTLHGAERVPGNQ